MEQSREGVAPSPTPCVVAIEKGASVGPRLRSPTTYLKLDLVFWPVLKDLLASESLWEFCESYFLGKFLICPIHHLYVLLLCTDLIG